MLFFKTSSVIALFLLLFITHHGSSQQEISGVILDQNSKAPLAGASIYFDNTTSGTISDIDGEFRIAYDPNIKTPLVVSFMGYKTKKFYKFNQGITLKIYLDESQESLDEVVLTYDDGLSRAIKLSEFRKHYLGESENGKSCEILNEDDLILIFNAKNKQLTAKSKAPILVKNSALEYLISTEMEHFEINYSSVSRNKKRLRLSSIHYAGTNFFKSFQENPSASIIQKREEAYHGSVIHFMRALHKNKLKEHDYTLFDEDVPVNPSTKKYPNVVSIANSTDVFVNLKNKLSVLYKNRLRSTIESSVDVFIIDSFGNHSPSDKVEFTGHMGNQRMGDLLPFDFSPSNVENKVKSP